MSMKPDKNGKYRVNFYLNPNSEKDKVIIEYLEQRYSASDFIKETLYSMATGSQFSTYLNTMSNTNMGSKVNELLATDTEDHEEEYEEIENPDDIELDME